MNKILSSLAIEKVVFRGYGLAHADGEAVFVASAVPGDVVNAQVLHRRGRVRLARIESYVQRSPHAIEPPCEVFGTCGGCDWLHLPYDMQLVFKQQMIEQLFGEVTGASAALQPIIASPQQTRYRNKAFLPVRLVDGKPRIGMFERRSHKVTPHRDCQLQPTLFDRAAATFRGYLEAASVPIYNERTHRGSVRFFGIRQAQATGEAVVVVVSRSAKLPFTRQLVRALTEAHPEIVGVVHNINTRRGNTILGEREKMLWGRPWIEERLGEHVFHIDYASFFQVNTGLAQAMYSFVHDKLGEESNVIDAFAGTGAIGIYIHQRAKNVWCVERHPAACRDATENAARASADNLCVVRGEVETEVPRLCREHSIDTIIFDPPRRGLDAATIEAVATTALRRVIYISCNAGTQVRDVQRLQAHGFSLTLVQPFDMFPQTHHTENLCILERTP
ncbi:MAG: 23S rRNA (uracil(1939)-C(5))-methyltransferase RlmD [Candidatus Cloacimonetes bacterium]|nr:23S rRNA (uracil(1939)-C(5))-methyltransferase RlmD [Candidatus Cloacimonadota bacterium]